MGGENGPRTSCVSTKLGSSPHGRGKLIMTKIKRFVCRLIPARAGKTLRAVMVDRMMAAHPRAGGENLQRLVIISMQAGSSPRGRGKLEVPTGPGGGEGLIPARAGKTCPLRRRAGPWSAHPRAGGENGARDGASQSRPGSSPRGRGKPCRVCTCVRCRGLIPARAGKTSDRSYTVSSA